MLEYYHENFESYSKLFAKHADEMTQLMKILCNKVAVAGLPPVKDPKDLFSMVLDLSYHVDQSYKSENDIKDNDTYRLYLDKNDFASEMRSILKEELDRYLGYNNAEQ